MLKAAKDYVNKQLAIMKEYDAVPNLSTEAYNRLVQQVVDATK